MKDLHLSVRWWVIQVCNYWAADSLDAPGSFITNSKRNGRYYNLFHFAFIKHECYNVQYIFNAFHVDESTGETDWSSYLQTCLCWLWLRQNKGRGIFVCLLEVKMRTAFFIDFFSFFLFCLIHKCKKALKPEWKHACRRIWFSWYEWHSLPGHMCSKKRYCRQWEEVGWWLTLLDEAQRERVINGLLPWNLWQRVKIWVVDEYLAKVSRFNWHRTVC